MAEGGEDVGDDFRISQERLLAEVLKRPELYDKTSPDYGSPGIRQMLWIGVCTNAIENWEELPSRRKLAKVREVRRLWDHLKGNFMRQLYQQVNQQTNQSTSNPAEEREAEAEADPPRTSSPPGIPSIPVEAVYSNESDSDTIIIE